MRQQRLCSTTLRAKLAVDSTKKFKKNLDVDGMHSSNLAVANIEFNSTLRATLCC